MNQETRACPPRREVTKILLPWSPCRAVVARRRMIAACASFCRLAILISGEIQRISAVARTDIGLNLQQFVSIRGYLLSSLATGAARESVEREMHDAIEFHLDGLRRAGEPIP